MFSHSLPLCVARRKDGYVETLEAIRTKRATRVFSDAPLPEQAIEAILNAGRRAHSGANLQPWHFIAVRNRETLQALSKCGDYAGHLAGAALGVVVASPSDPNGWNMFDIGQAAALMQLAAHDLRIGSCIAGIFNPAAAREILGVGSDLDLQVVISFGYPLDAESLTRQPKAGGRRPLHEVVHWEHW